MGDRFPTYRLENHTNSRMFYGQVGVRALTCLFTFFSVGVGSQEHTFTEP